MELQALLHRDPDAVGQAHGVGCPHCRKPIKPEWQFCPYCAKSTSAVPVNNGPRKLASKRLPALPPATNIAAFKK